MMPNQVVTMTVTEAIAIVKEMMEENAPGNRFEALAILISEVSDHHQMLAQHGYE